MLPGEISLSYFKSQLSIHIVKFWYNKKDEHIHQKKRNSFDESFKKV